MSDRSEPMEILFKQKYWPYLCLECQEGMIKIARKYAGKKASLFLKVRYLNEIRRVKWCDHCVNTFKILSAEEQVRP